MNQTYRLRQYAALAVATAAMVHSACKKGEENDPDIYYTSLNWLLSIPEGDFMEDRIDLDDDGNYDFYISGYRYEYAGIPYSAVTLSGAFGSDNNVLTEQVIFKGVSVRAAKEQPGGTNISNTSMDWFSYCFLSYYDGDEVMPKGINGKGDKIIGLRFRISGQNHYGWVRVNISSNNESITLKDYAYHTKPNTGLGAGKK